VLDEDTGLYYYNARYYDPELGRFIQADPIVPSPDNPQTLNRYAYCGNNPLKYIDPSGYIFGIDDLIIGIIIGAAIGGATAAATGGNIGLGILTGAIGGLFGGLGAWAGSLSPVTAALGSVGGPLAGAVIGGAAGGAVCSAITGGDIGMGALTGAIAVGIGFGIGRLTEGLIKNLGIQNTGWGELAELGGVTMGGSLGAGIGAELQGGDFWTGARYGAIGASMGYGLGYFLKQNNGPLEAGDRNPFHHLAQFLGRIWNLPNTIVGLAWGGIGLLTGAKPTTGNNAIEFEENWFHAHVFKTISAALTLGNVINYRGQAVEFAYHEVWHTYQGHQLGPLYLPSNILGNFLQHL